MSQVPFVVTEQDEDGDWELAELDPEAEAKQLEVVLGPAEPVKVKDSTGLSGRQKQILEGWKDYP